MPGPPSQPRLHIANARVWTGYSAQPWASGLALAGGRVQSLDAGLNATAAARVVDARGRVVVPGLIDSHVHLLMAGASLTEVDLSTVRSRREFAHAVAAADAALPAGRWLIGRGWNEQNWGGEMPDKSWFASSVRAGRPCVCHRMDIHAVVVNETVLELIEARGLREPPGGRIVRDATGAPTGLFLEAAAWELVRPLVPELDAAGRREALIAAQNHAHALGLTAVGSMEVARDVREVFAPVRESGNLTLRCAITLLDRAVGSELLEIDAMDDIASDEWLSVIGDKTFIDGTLGSRTARMLEPYADHSRGAGDRGMFVELAAEGRLKEWIAEVARLGRSPSMHAIGDEAVRVALEAVESLPREMRDRVRPRIEHAQHIHPDDIARFAGGVLASMQPLHKADDGRSIEQRLDAQRARWAFPFQSLLNAGATLAFGSDWPVVSCDPVLGMRAAITGLTLDEQPFNVHENLSPEQALTAYTAGAARCLQLNQCGTIKVGGAADCVMFDIDPFTADWVRRPPRVIMTIVGGKVVFDATA